jgi:hypothetical protein
MRRLTILSVMCLVLGLATRSQAALETFDLSYSGASNGNSAIGAGTITVDTSLISTSGLTSLTGQVASPPTPWVTAFSLTISKASAPAADGTFGISDFNSTPGDIFIELTGPVDFSKDLVGQAGFDDFNFFSNGSDANAPTGIFFQLIGDSAGDNLVLTSFALAVTPPSGGGSSAPLPSSLTLGLLCLGTLAFGIRRYKLNVC